MISDVDDTVIEDDLVARLRAGDPEALAAAYTRWSDLVHSLALRLLGNHHDAQDVTQQVFVSAWHSRHTLREDGGSLPGWLVTITRRRCADFYEGRTRAGRAQAALAHTASLDHRGSGRPGDHPRVGPSVRGASAPSHLAQ